MYKIDYGHDILASQLAKIITIDEKTTANGKGDIVLAVSVSFPMTDLYVPFIITIAPSGKVAIEKEEDTINVTLWEAVADSTDVYLLKPLISPPSTFPY